MQDPAELRDSMCGSTAFESRNPVDHVEIRQIDLVPGNVGASGDARAVDQGIDPPERPCHRIDRRRYAGLRDFQRTRNGAVADLGRGCLGALPIAVQARHPHAVARHMQGGRLADFAPGADDCNDIVRNVEWPPGWRSGHAGEGRGKERPAL